MIKRQNDRLLRLLLLGVAALLILAGVLIFSDCGGKGDDWVSGSAEGSSQESSLNGVFSAPAFKSGSYVMESSVIDKEEYTDGNGGTLFTFSSTTKYKYLLDISADENGIICKYTFASIFGSSNTNGEETVELNTDGEMSSEELKPYYDLIGKSFVVTASADCSRVEIAGVDELTAAVPGAAGLLDKDSLLSMARDIFYKMPSSFTDGTSWVVNSYGVDNTYSVRRFERGRFSIGITGGEPALPSPTTSAEGYVTVYDSASPLTGTLFIDRDDRAVQELSTNQRYGGSISDADGYGYFFVITSTTQCSVEKASEE